MSLEVCKCGADSVIVLKFKGLCKSCFKKETNCDDPAFYTSWLKSQGKIKNTDKESIMEFKIRKAKNEHL